LYVKEKISYVKKKISYVKRITLALYVKKKNSYVKKMFSYVKRYYLKDYSKITVRCDGHWAIPGPKAATKMGDFEVVGLVYGKEWEMGNPTRTIVQLYNTCSGK
jgi:hypothetical protein